MRWIGGLILAAGASSRAGSPKALAPFDGETFLSRTVRVLREAGCDEVVVVTRPELASVLASGLDARVVVNPVPARGMASSLRCGLEHARGWEAGVVALVDHPSVQPGTVRALLERFARGDVDLVRPSFGGRRGHPYVAGASLLHRLRDAPEVGARTVLAEVKRTVDLPVEDPAILEDLDLGKKISAS